MRDYSLFVDYNYNIYKLYVKNKYKCCKRIEHLLSPRVFESCTRGVFTTIINKLKATVGRRARRARLSPCD